MRSIPADGDLLRWPRVREFAVPPSMIETATARRTVGDWAGARAAARVDADLDPRAVARLHGRELAALVRADLRHLAADLLRWHLPRWRGASRVARGRCHGVGGAGPRRRSTRRSRGATCWARRCGRRPRGAGAGQDYTYGWPARRSAALPGIVLPAPPRRVPRVTVVIDTSGSVSDAELGSALLEVAAIGRSLGRRR